MSAAVRGHSLTDPRALAALRDLLLVARTVVDGLMLGVHTSHRAGAGLEFSQFRSYQPGDDLRRVDWKLYARSDRFFIRESEAETSMAVRLVVDATGSMAQTTAAGVTTLDYARYVAAALALLAQRQGDALGLFTVSDASLQVLQPRREHQQLHRGLHALERLEPAGGWPEWSRVEGAIAADPHRGIVVLVSDLHERTDEVQRAAQRLAANRHEVVVLHLENPDELEFPWRGSVTFEEMETGRRVELDAGAARERYLAHRADSARELQRALEERRIDYHRIRTDEPLDSALRRVLHSRATGPGHAGAGA